MIKYKNTVMRDVKDAGITQKETCLPAFSLTLGICLVFINSIFLWN